MGDNHRGGFLEAKSRVVYSLLRAAVRVGLRLRLPLDQLLLLTKMAYVEEARERRGLELENIAALFGKSLRTVSSLHSTFRGDFFAPEREVQLRRQVAAVVNDAAQTPAELAARFATRSPDALDAAIEDLVRGGTIVFDGSRYRRNPEDHDFFDETNLARRVDGLNRQMDILAGTVWHRLLDANGDPDAAARSYVFDADDERFRALVSELLGKLRTDAIAADAAAEQTGGLRRGITLAACTLTGEETS